MRSRLVVLGAAALCVACGGSAKRVASTRPTPAQRPPTITTPTTTTATSTTADRPKPKPKRKSQPSPGSLPQTSQLPPADTPQFHAEMAALWSGVVNDSLSAAEPAFFPEGAYAQVKGIANPRGDYVDRLLVDYKLDLGATHALLGSQPHTAELVGVQVPETYAHWVNPGACYNTVGYYEVPNARVIYRQGGQVHSFGIASMISWRGVWYVVHLGAILRPSAGGVVDDPSSGVGESAPSSTC